MSKPDQGLDAGKKLNKDIRMKSQAICIDRADHSMVQATDVKEPDQHQILIQSLPSVLPAFENHPPHRHDDVELVAE
ncbi:MAG TPA: hypothetical protein EYQ18_06835 [Candidatus Handelsmanbacteria bacterium]|nr:hypothetical protein [Candidatus Handelsmanbacteria bacterium]